MIENLQRGVYSPAFYAREVLARGEVAKNWRSKRHDGVKNIDRVCTNPFIKWIGLLNISLENATPQTDKDGPYVPVVQERIRNPVPHALSGDLIFEYKPETKD